MTTVISLSNINLTGINDKYIIKNINFDINKGDCIVFSGHNGAGKTTLFKIITGLVKPTSGNVKFFDNTTNSNIKKQIGYIPQINNFKKNLPVSVRQAIEIGLSAKKGIFTKISKQDSTFIDNIAKKLEIYHLLNSPVGKLSGGEMQKVSIARVLVQEANIILLDEPLSHLDTKSQKNIIKIIEDIHFKKTATILIILHNSEQIPKCCNKIITMENGEIVSCNDRLQGYIEATKKQIT